MIRRLAAALAVAACLGAAAPAFAHGVGSSTLRLRVDGARIAGDWQLNLHDARLAVGLDPAAAGPPAFAELRGREDSLRAVLLHSLALRANGQPCPLRVEPAPMTWNREFDYVQLGLEAACPVAPTRLAIRTDLLFDRDPKHRAYFSVEDARVVSVGVLRTDQRSVEFGIRQFHAGEIALEFIREGVWHIWTGFDHMLFLIALLLPAPLLLTARQWTVRPGLRDSAHEVLKVVTAFTLSHSLSLALSFFGLVRPPAQWVEVGIALSVFAAAWNNLRPFLPGRAWTMAFGFGLVHGLGFAGALGNLSLPRQSRVLALASFNVGVEFGQLAIVAVALPVLYAASRRRPYPRLVMGIGSLLIAWLAVIWTLQRAFNLELFHGL